MGFGSLYSKQALKHFQNPQNVGEIKNPSGQATVGNPVCGDVMRMFVRVKKNRIEDIKFQTLGCGAAIATSSVVTQMAKGKTLKAAQKISKKQVVDKLGGLPAAKLHCSVLAVEALKKAIEDALKKD